ncbi:hypothetical protein FHR75_004074 [Kineococcus radiotolerans]|uniref:Uncharacterized protein n=1 Tax=Kineococcus radiotolerans TaxID=131568 RepID=A0A7W4TQJ2_KINRA|nr:hypothetical protein [Kineococcus radiotolerans]
MHAPTVGILLGKDRHEQVVRYALAGAPAPMAVATYTYDTLPPDQQASLPNPTQLSDQLGSDLSDALTDALDDALDETPPPPASADNHDSNDQ